MPGTVPRLAAAWSRPPLCVSATCSAEKAYGRLRAADTSMAAAAAAAAQKLGRCLAAVAFSRVCVFCPDTDAYGFCSCWLHRAAPRRTRRCPRCGRLWELQEHAANSTVMQSWPPAAVCMQDAASPAFIPPTHTSTHPHTPSRRTWAHPTPPPHMIPRPRSRGRRAPGQRPINQGGAPRDLPCGGVGHGLRRPFQRQVGPPMGRGQGCGCGPAQRAVADRSGFPRPHPTSPPAVTCPWPGRLTSFVAS